MAIEITITLRCSMHHEEELSAEVDLRKGIGYVMTCLKCLQEARASQLKILTDRLLEFRTAEDIPVIPHTRKRPRGKKLTILSPEAEGYHCAGCHKEIDPANSDVSQDNEGKFLCASCAEKPC